MGKKNVDFRSCRDSLDHIIKYSFSVNGEYNVTHNMRIKEYICSLLDASSGYIFINVPVLNRDLMFDVQVINMSQDCNNN